MAGPLDIQRFPVGLLDLFGLKATGDTPHLLEQAVGTGIDVLNLYLMDRLEFRVAATAVAPVAVGYLGLATPTGPPAGSLWLLYSASLQVSQTAPAGVAISLQPVIRRGQVAVYEALADLIQLGPANGALMGRHHYESPIVMRPTDELGVYTSSISGAPAVTAVMSYSYVQLTR